MNKRLRVHGQKYNVGDNVYLKIDFDNNALTWKNSLEPFWHNNIFIVQEILNDCTVRIVNEAKQQVEIVSTTQIKKVHY